MNIIVNVQCLQVSELESESHRKFYRRIGIILESICSCWRHVNSGVPQGNVLGPVLLLIGSDTEGSESYWNQYVPVGDMSIVECRRGMCWDMSFC